MKNKNNGLINISGLKKETINIRIDISSYNINKINGFYIFIFYSDYNNIFVLNSSENNGLTICSIAKKDYYIYIDLSKGQREIYLKYKAIDNIRLYLSGYYYFYQTNDIAKIQNQLPPTSNYSGEYYSDYNGK